MKMYIVWVGGVSMYEGKNKERAMISYNHWIRMGYDDVILEEIEE
jgi:hypothetical protein